MYLFSIFWYKTLGVSIIGIALREQLNFSYYEDRACRYYKSTLLKFDIKQMKKKVTPGMHVNTALFKILVDIFFFIIASPVPCI